MGHPSRIPPVMDRVDLFTIHAKNLFGHTLLFVAPTPPPPSTPLQLMVWMGHCCCYSTPPPMFHLFDRLAVPFED